jgi:hypothetical protein
LPSVYGNALEGILYDLRCFQEHLLNYRHFPLRARPEPWLSYASGWIFHYQA